MKDLPPLSCKAPRRGIGGGETSIECRRGHNPPDSVASKRAITQAANSISREDTTGGDFELPDRFCGSRHAE